ncbi:hypothetical protein SO802_010749 [Lithocarpus litseifolius]|uniref:Uncharacterized protein n=1 Tax=Lithocarpus litseifolius TaxID=425828 RepID=A0AAW2DF26_9ROSI
MTLQLMGSANYNLKRFNDSLGYLNRANRLLGRLEEEGFSGEDVMPMLHAVQLELANVKTTMGRREEALGNLRKCLEIKEVTFEKDSRELGKSHQDLVEAYVAVLNFKEFLSYCMKALEIHKKQLGQNSVEVAIMDAKVSSCIFKCLEKVYIEDGPMKPMLKEIGYLLWVEMMLPWLNILGKIQPVVRFEQGIMFYLLSSLVFLSALLSRSAMVNMLTPRKGSSHFYSEMDMVHSKLGAVVGKPCYASMCCFVQLDVTRRIEMLKTLLV